LALLGFDEITADVQNNKQMRALRPNGLFICTSHPQNVEANSFAVPRRSFSASPFGKIA
jgi:hypothetical protein